jgi:hypothetical protein
VAKPAVMPRAAAATGGTARSRAAAAPARPRRAAGIPWDKVGRLALLAVLYIPPVTHLFQQRSTAHRSQQQLHELQAERTRLRTRLHELSGPGAIEREARKLGMTKRDERPYVVTP